VTYDATDARATDYIRELAVPVVLTYTCIDWIFGFSPPGNVNVAILAVEWSKPVYSHSGMTGAGLYTSLLRDAGCWNNMYVRTFSPDFPHGCISKWQPFQDLLNIMCLCKF
jgi:hypothetical protein